MFWVIPAAVVLVAVVPVIAGVRRAGREAALLRRAMGDLAALREPVEALRTDLRQVTAKMPEMRLRTRPAPPPAP